MASAYLLLTLPRIKKILCSFSYAHACKSKPRIFIRIWRWTQINVSENGKKCFSDCIFASCKQKTNSPSCCCQKYQSNLWTALIYQLEILAFSPLVSPFVEIASTWFLLDVVTLYFYRCTFKQETHTNIQYTVQCTYNYIFILRKGNNTRVLWENE